MGNIGSDVDGVLLSERYGVTDYILSDGLCQFQWRHVNAEFGLGTSVLILHYMI